jgi:hypothetical protein
LSHAAKVYIDDRLLNHREIFELATNDGFGEHTIFFNGLTKISKARLFIGLH